jgi:pyrroline-5-carboxylate reductase
MGVQLVVIGGGKMGEALVGGLCAAGWAPASDVLVVEASEARRTVLRGPTGLAGRHPGLVVAAPDEVDPAVIGTGVATDVVAGPDATAGPTGAAQGRVEAALIAVKPDDVAGACALAGRLGVHRLLSVAAGVTIDALTRWSAPDGTGPAPAVLRAMPNTPALVGAGAAGLAGGPGCGEEDLAWAEGVLAAVGVVVRVAEGSLDAVTGLSGSGPAYVFLVAEALVDAGVFVGLSRTVATTLAVQTLVGAARMLDETGQGPEELRAGVTSPGGTTAAGLRALEVAAVRSAFIDAVVAATARSRELGGG